MACRLQGSTVEKRQMFDRKQNTVKPV